MPNQTTAMVLSRELERVESEVRSLARESLRSRADGAHLVALAAREYEILEAMSRPWRHLAESSGTDSDG